jgi:hypothetical protein
MDAFLITMKLHIKYLCSLEDTQRVRATCRAYTQKCAMSLHPDQENIRNEFRRDTSELGARRKSRIAPEIRVAETARRRSVRLACSIGIAALQGKCLV